MIAMQMHRNTPAEQAAVGPARAAYSRSYPRTSRLVVLPGPRARARVRCASFGPLAIFLGLFGRQRFRAHEPAVEFWYKALDLEIPLSASMEGGVYLWKDGRQVPDTVSVTLQQPEEILVSWVSGLGNNHLGVTEDVLGTHGSISRAQPSPLRAAKGESAGSAGSRPRRWRTSRRSIGRISSTASEWEASRTAPWNWAIAFPSPAAWPWKAIAKAARFAGTRSAKKSSNPAHFL